MPEQPNASRDWSSFYADLIQSAQIPWTSSQQYEPARVVVRDLYVDLDSVYAKIRGGGLSPRTISVYADTVRLSPASEIVLRGNALLVTARQVLADGPVSVFLDYRGDSAARLVLYTDGVEGELAAKVMTSDGSSAPASFDLSGVRAPGALVAAAGGAPALSAPPPLGDSGLQAGTPGQALLRSALQSAIALFDSDPVTCRAILQWILTLTQQAPQAADVRLQSGALLAQLDGAASQVTFVPYLDKDVYLKVTAAYLESAQAFETQYERFTDQEQDLQSRKDAAKLMLEHYRELAGFNDDLARQGRSNLQGAQTAEIQARTSLQIQQSQVATAQIAFKYDAKIWAREQILKAVFSMVVAIGQVAVAVAMMAVGNEAAAPAAGAAVADGALAAAEVAEVAKTVSDLSAIQKLMASIASVMGRLKKVGEALPKIFEAVNQLVVASGNISSAVDLSALAELPGEDIAAQDNWDIFRLDTQQFLKPAVDAGVTGAAEYQLALDKLCIYGKAYMASQVGLIKAAQNLVRLQLQSKLARDDEQRLQGYVDRLSEDAEVLGELAQSFYQRELDIRAWFYIALQNYTWAFRYWALRASRVNPSMTKPVTDLQADMATVAQEWADTLSSFDPPPAPFNIPVVVSDTTAGLYSGVVASLRTKGAVRIPVPLDTDVFRSLNRVRVDRVRAWLVGVAASEQHPVTVQVATAGQYDDRLGTGVFRFAASQAQRQFQYTGAPGDASQIRVDGTLARREQDAYFLPTAFTDWILMADPAHNPGVDLAALTAIRLEFAGEGLPRT